MVERDRQPVPVLPPERAEHQLGPRAGVDEQDGEPGLEDQPVELRHGVEADAAGPRHAVARDEEPHLRLGPALAAHHDGALRARRQVTEQAVGVGHRRRQPGEGGIGCQGPQAGEPEAQQRPALALGQRVQLVEHDPPQPREVAAGVRVGEQQRQRLRRRQQHLRRLAPLPLAAVRGRVAGADLVAHRQPHLAHRCGEVARDVVGERLQRRDVERVQALGHPGSRLPPARPGSAESRPASCRRPWVPPAARPGPPRRPPAWPAGAHAAASRAARTSRGTPTGAARRARRRRHPQ